MIYREATAQIVPNFWEEAPVERAIVTDTLWFMDQTSAVQVGFTGLNYAKPPYNKFSVIRSRFDHWLAKKAEEAGAHLMTSCLVKDLIFEKEGLTGKKVAGVVLDDGSKLYSDAVILAEGAMADLAAKAGLRREISADSLKIYVKEILALPREIIEARFNLEKDEGVIIGMVGFPTSGAVGKGGIWTNRDSISLVVGGYLNQIVNKGLNLYQLLNRLEKTSHDQETY